MPIENSCPRESRYSSQTLRAAVGSPSRRFILLSTRRRNPCLRGRRYFLRSQISVSSHRKEREIRFFADVGNSFFPCCLFPYELPLPNISRARFASVSENCVLLFIIILSRKIAAPLSGHIQWLTKVFQHPLTQNNFFKIGPGDLSFFEKLDGLVY